MTESCTGSDQKTILIAEDEPINFMLLEKMLEKTRMRILWAKNGREAVEKARSTPEIKLILMDIRMPVMDGIEATKIIHQELPHLPIISVTAYTLSNERELCKEAGAIDFLTKPVNPSSLLKAVAEYAR